MLRRALDLKKSKAAVREVIDYPHPRMPRNVREAGQAALDHLAVRLEEAEQQRDEWKELARTNAEEVKAWRARNPLAAEARVKELEHHCDRAIRNAQELDALREALEPSRAASRDVPRSARLSSFGQLDKVAKKHRGRAFTRAP